MSFEGDFSKGLNWVQIYLLKGFQKVFRDISSKVLFGYFGEVLGGFRLSSIFNRSPLEMLFRFKGFAGVCRVFSEVFKVRFCL